jgi:hypothetical protein
MLLLQVLLLILAAVWAACAWGVAGATLAVEGVPPHAHRAAATAALLLAASVVVVRGR